MKRCSMCYGTGRNKRGGPCRYCKATGVVGGLDAATSAANATSRTFMQLVWALVILGVIVAIAISSVH